MIMHQIMDVVKQLPGPVSSAIYEKVSRGEKCISHIARGSTNSTQSYLVLDRRGGTLALAIVKEIEAHFYSDSGLCSLDRVGVSQLTPWESESQASGLASCQPRKNLRPPLLSCDTTACII